MVLKTGTLGVATAPHVVLDDGTRTVDVQLLRIDPDTNDVSGRIDNGYGLFGLGSGDGFLWVCDSFTRLTQMDPAVNAIVRRLPIPDGGSSCCGDPGIDADNGTV